MGCGALQSERAQFIETNLTDEDRTTIAQIFNPGLPDDSTTHDRSELVGSVAHHPAPRGWLIPPLGLYESLGERLFWAAPPDGWLVEKG